MPRDHIIPQFILRGFAINPTANKQNLKLMIYDKETKQVHTEKIADAYAIRDFNSPETEKYLAQNYESDIARIFQRVAENVKDCQKNIILSNAEYKLLFRFFVIMWRRNDIQLGKAKEMGIQLETMIKSIFGNKYDDMIKPEYKGYNFEKLFDERIDDIRKTFYDKVIPETNDNDPTVQKTIRYYKPFIVFNKSNIHFLLHNTYATLRYFIPKNHVIDEFDVPSIMIYPISNVLSFCMLRCATEIDITKDVFEIPIEVWDKDDDIKQFFIDGYITNVATSFVVDNTNLEFVTKIFQNE